MNMLKKPSAQDNIFFLIPFIKKLQLHCQKHEGKSRLPYFFQILQWLLGYALKCKHFHKLGLGCFKKFLQKCYSFLEVFMKLCGKLSNGKAHFTLECLMECIANHPSQSRQTFSYIYIYIYIKKTSNLKELKMTSDLKRLNKTPTILPNVGLYG